MKKEGFTLIELMIVIAIVGTLAGISTAMYLHFRPYVKVSEAYINLGKIRAAEETYRAEHDFYISCLASPPGGGTDAAPDTWDDAGGGFSTVGFAPSGPVRFQYEVIAAGTTYIATAIGDLDEDEIQATITVTDSQPKPVKTPAGEL